jgi:hypothetical protein
MVDEAWLRERGYMLVGETAIRQPPPASSPQGEGGSDDVPESLLLANVRRCARERGFLVYHTYSSRKSEAGFPDLTLVRPGRLIFAEVKTRIGKLTRQQEMWLDLLKRSVPGVEVVVWRPSDWPDLREQLR